VVPDISFLLTSTSRIGANPIRRGPSTLFPGPTHPYVPSLSTLVESRKPGAQTIGKLSVLLVAQPDEKMPEALREMKEVQAVDTQVTTLFSATAIPTKVLAHLRDHRFAHIVCHGILEPGKPFESLFKLYRGEHLLLLDIVTDPAPGCRVCFLVCLSHGRDDRGEYCG
jgi:hypothetical protein